MRCMMIQTLDMYDVYYTANDSDIAEVDFTRFLAIDETHAREQFRRQYPDLEIDSVERRNYKIKLK